MNALRNVVAHSLYWLGHGTSRVFEMTESDWVFSVYCWLMRQSCKVQGVGGPWR